jgi:thiamine-monophosphate kinase
LNERLSDLGEFGLIERIALLAPAGREIVGIGDDAAVLPGPPGMYTLATVDMQVEDVHFRLDDRSPGEIGATALAVNISDIAAMGGEPRFALLSLAARPEMATRTIEEVVAGICNLATRFRMGLVGGNLTRTSGPLCIDITVLGDVPCGEILLRSGAQEGDLLAVTGTLGGRAAMRLARDAGIDGVPSIPVPEPRVNVARRLAMAGILHAMMDISDGLAGDIMHLAEASSVGAIVDADLIPAAPLAVEFARRLGTSAVDLALGGGEDYELLIALPRTVLEEARALGDAVGLTVIGEVVGADRGLTLRNGTRTRPLVGGWRHF